MKQPESKAKKKKKEGNNKPVFRPVFNADFVKNIIAKSSNSYALQGKLLTEMLDRQAPFFQSMVERMNEAAKVYQSTVASLANSGIFDHMKEIAKARAEIEESLKKFNKDQENYSWRIEKPLITRYAPEIETEKPIKLSDQDIDNITDKLWEKIEQRGTQAKFSIRETVARNISVNENYPKSIHLVASSLEPKDAIFVVLDEIFDKPVRFSVFDDNRKIAYIKKLFNIAYLVNVPGKRVDYDKNLADSINNGLFRRRKIQKYMRTNKFKKPTLVQKTKDNILVLKNDIPVKIVLISNTPTQHQSLYIDKTR